MPYPGRMDTSDCFLRGNLSGLCNTSLLSILNEIVILEVEIIAGEVVCFCTGLRVFSSSRRTLTWASGTTSPVTLSETAGTSKVMSDPIGNPTR